VQTVALSAYSIQLAFCGLESQSQLEVWGIKSVALCIYAKQCHRYQRIAIGAFIRVFTGFFLHLKSEKDEPGVLISDVYQDLWREHLRLICDADH
jgi:hypothetical protein